ncbi:hypothetical protein H0173_18250 [Bacillus sp. S/N-304-OC-R1]|nr:hypothetical protein [Bacillus sp. S/N-304-OC-R1]
MGQSPFYCIMMNWRIYSKSSGYRVGTGGYNEKVADILAKLEDILK